MVIQGDLNARFVDCCLFIAMRPLFVFGYSLTRESFTCFFVGRDLTWYVVVVFVNKT